MNPITVSVAQTVLHTAEQNYGCKKLHAVPYTGHGSLHHFVHACADLAILREEEERSYKHSLVMKQSFPIFKA